MDVRPKAPFLFGARYMLGSSESLSAGECTSSMNGTLSGGWLHSGLAVAHSGAPLFLVL
jgi:hypothetical protein